MYFSHVMVYCVGICVLLSTLKYHLSSLALVSFSHSRWPWALGCLWPCAAVFPTLHLAGFLFFLKPSALMLCLREFFHDHPIYSASSVVFSWSSVSFPLQCLQEVSIAFCAFCSSPY